jgi:hypothetical protein
VPVNAGRGRCFGIAGQTSVRAIPLGPRVAVAYVPRGTPPGVPSRSASPCALLPRSAVAGRVAVPRGTSSRSAPGPVIRRARTSGRLPQARRSSVTGPEEVPRGTSIPRQLVPPREPPAADRPGGYPSNCMRFELTQIRGVPAVTCRCRRADPTSPIRRTPAPTVLPDRVVAAGARGTPSPGADPALKFGWCARSGSWMHRRSAAGRAAQALPSGRGNDHRPCTVMTRVAATVRSSSRTPAALKSPCVLRRVTVMADLREAHPP